MSTPSEPVSEPEVDTVVTSVVDTVPESEEPQPASGPESTNVAPKRKIDDISDIAQPAPAPKVPKTFVKDKTHWFSDGNVLLQIGDTRFKLHRGRLTRESLWFQALIDQRAKGVPSQPYDHQREIDQVLQSAERVGKIDLFYLDFADGPTADEFRTFLSAMENGIDHVYDQPSFDDMVQIYETANFFCVERYASYTRRYLQDLFPDSVHSITPNPSPHAARALRLGMDYNLEEIVPHCYYDLARMHPLRLPEEKDPDSDNQDGSEDDDNQIPNKDSNATTATGDEWTSSAITLKNASATTFFRLLNIQRENVLSWDRIGAHLKYQCPGSGDCRLVHKPTSSFIEGLKKRYPFDPIMGIQTLLLKDSDLKKYCPSAKRAVENKLQSEYTTLWSRIKDHALL